MASLKYIQSSTLQAVTLGAGYTAASGTMTLTGGEGALLPSSGDFWLAYNNGAGTIRLFKVTARSTDTLTVVAVSGEGSGDGNISSGETLRWALTYDALTQLRTDIVGQVASGLTFLEEQTASASASLNFTTALTSTHQSYMIVASDLRPATDGALFRLRVSTDGGSSYISTGSYTWHYFIFSGAGTAFSSSTTDTSIRMSGNGQESTATEPPTTIVAYIHNPLGTSDKKTFEGTTTEYSAAGSYSKFLWHGYYNGATTAINAFQVIASSGNIASGTVRVYGLTKA